MTRPSEPCSCEESTPPEGAAEIKSWKRLTHIPYTLHHNYVNKFGVKDLGKQKQDRLVLSFTFMLSV